MKRITFHYCLVFIVLFSFIACESTSIKLDSVAFEYIGMSEYNKNAVYRLAPDEEASFNIAMYVVVPQEIKAEHMLVVPFKSGELSQFISKKDNLIREMLLTDDGRYARITSDTGSVTVYPVIPEVSNNFRHLEMDPETLLSNDKYRHLDDQICSALDALRTYLSSKLGIEMPYKVNMAGYSGEGNFTVRFALLHPDRLHVAYAGGISWAPSLALSELKGEELEYPLGISDIEKYTDDFNLEAWKEIRFMIDMGLLDDRGSYVHEQLETLDWARQDALDENFEPVWNVFKEAFAELSPNAELVTYLEDGHSHNYSRTIDFIRENDSEQNKFTPIIPLEPCRVLVSAETEKTYNTHNL